MFRRQQKSRPRSQRMLKRRSPDKSASLLQRLQRVWQQRPGSTKLDLRLVYLAIAFFGFGLLMIYSASAVVAYHDKGTTFYYLLRQSVWITAGVIFAYIAYRFPLSLLSKYAASIILIGIAGLVLVLLIGEDINGARRWIYFSGLPFPIQPSELAKLCFVIYLAAWLSRVRPVIKNIKGAIRDHFYNDLLPFLLLIGLIGGLVLLQPDLDTAVIIVLTAIAVYFVSGKDALHTLGTLSIVLVGSVMGVLVTATASYRMKRIQVWIDLIKGSLTDAQKRNEAFQVWNGLLAIANGGLIGVGYGQSTQKLYYLQETAWTDSIFAVIAEEFGLLGSIVVIVGFLYFMSIGISIALKADNKFNALLAIGITSWITVQAFLNIGANLALFPFGGIPLPFLSYGGSSVIVVMVGLGLLLNISRSAKHGR